jgi:hypothetical protein
LDFKKWVKSIKTAGYNGARTVFKMWKGSKNGALKANTEGQLVLKKIKGYLWENSSFSKLTQNNPLWYDLKKYI